MRDDIRKVVFERAKANRTWAKKRKRNNRILLDSDGLQFEEASNLIRTARQKYRNSHFNAIRGFLTRNVGKPWDVVYSAVCARADNRNLLGREIRTYVEDCVATNCWIDGHLIMHYDWQGRSRQVDGYYVHPATGRLQRTSRRKS